jgi:hypothetical protein
MKLVGFGKIFVRIVTAVLAVLICAFALVFAEQRRTDAELDTILSEYLSDGILHDAHDWSSGKGILVVLQRDAQQPGLWKWRWLYPFDKRLTFHQSTFLTRCSFSLSNALPGALRLNLQLPAGVKAAVADRHDLEERSFTSEFQSRFPNNLGYLAVSRAGLSFDGTEAIFYIDHFCGLCGGGRYVLMRKSNGVWKIIDEHYTWVS